MRSVYNAIKVGRCEVVQVLKVDTAKGYIDLSKKRVQAEKLQEAEDKYAKSK
jgi:translation initiation factor 2 subunit 1